MEGTARTASVLRSRRISRGKNLVQNTQDTPEKNKERARTAPLEGKLSILELMLSIRRLSTLVQIIVLERR